MEKEFKFVVTGDEEATVYRAIEVIETGVYRIEWDDDDDDEDDSISFTHFLPLHVKRYLDESYWVVVE